MILKTQSQHSNVKLVTAVVQKEASYEKALEAAFDVFKVPQGHTKKGLALRCRLEGSRPGTDWMVIQPAVWDDIVDDMEFFLCGFNTDLLP
ncbi:hypothetical protein BYT27DRAFT_7201897 [Phlegmacium glaucopus]|nr:hypothetical protein BYT27DRAFT_7201897 [Phlegmacium glaucopus]